MVEAAVEVAFVDDLAFAVFARAGLIAEKMRDLVTVVFDEVLYLVLS